MSITDPVANMLTKIRNAVRAGKNKVDVKFSKMNEGILNVLKNEKFITNFKTIPDQTQGVIRVYFKFDEEGGVAIQELVRISKPGLRIYVKSKEIPKVLEGLGIAIVSTSKGLMTDNEAREKSLGGEVLCYVW